MSIKKIVGFVVKDGSDTKFKMWGDSGPEWTDNEELALRFARREDAERFSQEDEDAWHIRPVFDIEPVPTLSRKMIRDIFLAHGFTIKEGQSDLKPYVFEAAEELIRQLEVRHSMIMRCERESGTCVHVHDSADSHEPCNRENCLYAKLVLSPQEKGR